MKEHNAVAVRVGLIAALALAAGPFGLAERSYAQQNGGRQNLNGDNPEPETLPVQGNIHMIAGVGSNVTLQVGEEGVFVVDTSVARISDYIIGEARKLSKRPIRWIVNTTVDPDHTGGNANVAKQVHEDQPRRAPGPFLGDYAGLPINDAAHQKAESWDALKLSVPEEQANPHPAQYSMRGPGPNMRVSKIIDPVTEQLIGYSFVGMYGRADRTVWVDGRPHPSEYAEHLWQGFSTGVFHDGELTVTTTHMKAGVIQRIGVPSSRYGRMTEHFFRHGLYLTKISVIDDPIYLEEPFVGSQTWVWNPTQNATPPVAFDKFDPVDELPGKALGYVQHYPLGTHHTEFAKTYGLPFEATQGGKEGTYPEYQIKLQKMLADMKEAAQKDAAAGRSTPAR